MSTRIWWGIIILLLLVIGVLVWFLFTTPAPAKLSVPVATTTPIVATTTPTGDQPLSKSVVVTTPKANAKVAKTFNVSGQAPGMWFSEATFPIQVRDPNDNVVGRIGANAQGEWMTQGLVKFTATMNIDTTYTGPATLILMRDNPSGLPENDDSVEVPIIVQ